MIFIICQLDTNIFVKQYKDIGAYIGSLIFINFIEGNYNSVFLHLKRNGGLEFR